MANENFDYSGIETELKQRAADKGLAYDPSDLEGVKRNSQYDNGGQTPDQALKNQLSVYDSRSNNTPNSNGNNNGTPGNQNEGSRVTQAWQSPQVSTTPPAAPAPDPNAAMLMEMLKRQQDTMAAQETERKTKADQLFGTYQDRANQTLAFNAQDPIISGQVDAYRAEQERSKRNYLSDLAEKAGPNANLLAEERLANEHLGSNVSGYQAKLMSDELTNRRAEIAQALASEGSMLSLDQQQQLQEKLASIDALLKQQGITQSGQLGNRGLDITSQGQLLQNSLGNRGLDNDWAKALLSNDQFYGNLGLQAEQAAAYQRDLENGWLGNS